MSTTNRGLFSPWFCLAYPLIRTAAAFAARPQWLPTTTQVTLCVLQPLAWMLTATLLACCLSRRFLTNFTWSRSGQVAIKPRVSTVCSVAILTIYVRGVGKVTRFDHFCRSLENNSLARCFRDDQRSKEVRNSKNTRSVWSASPSHQSEAEGSNPPISALFYWLNLCVCLEL